MATESSNLNLLGIQILKLQTSAKLGLLARTFRNGRNATGIAQFRGTVKKKRKNGTEVAPGGTRVLYCKMDLVANKITTKTRSGPWAAVDLDLGFCRRN